MDAEDIAVGRRLKAARTAAGMQTRKELTDAAGLHRVGEKVLGMIERGQRKLQAHEAEAFAQALNIDARAFYDEPEGTQLDRIETMLREILEALKIDNTDQAAPDVDRLVPALPAKLGSLRDTPPNQKPAQGTRTSTGSQGRAQTP